MNIKIPYHGSCIPVPAAPVLEKLPEADGTKLRVLLRVLADPTTGSETLCDELNITKRSLTSALQFWADAGVLTLEEDAPEKKQAAAKSETRKTAAKAADAEPSPAKPQPVARASQLPHYTSDQVAEYINGHTEVRDLLTVAQQTMGKLFNTAETEIVIGLLDYLHLEADYILLLLTHCQKMGASSRRYRSMRYVEQLAIGLFDDGILRYEELDRHLQAIEAASGMEGQLRRLFGIGKRALTSKEKDAFTRWAGLWALPYDIIEKAYEITVDNTGGASVPYCNAILEKWHASGYETLEQVNAAQEQYRHDKTGAKDQKGSFDTDDFFEAALRRSYIEESKKEG